MYRSYVDNDRKGNKTVVSYRIRRGTDSRVVGRRGTVYCGSSVKGFAVGSRDGCVYVVDVEGAVSKMHRMSVLDGSGGGDGEEGEEKWSREMVERLDSVSYCQHWGPILHVVDLYQDGSECTRPKNGGGMLDGEGKIKGRSLFIVSGWEHHNRHNLYFLIDDNLRYIHYIAISDADSSY